MARDVNRHASKLAQKRWEQIETEERGRIMKIVRAGKIERAREGKQPQKDNFAIANAVLLRQNQRSRRKES